MNTVSIAVVGLPIASANKLCRDLLAVGTTAEREASDPRVYGDATLLNVVLLLNMAVLPVIAAFILKPRADKKKEISIKFRRIGADGSTTEIEINISKRERESKQLSASTIEQLASLFGLTNEKAAAAFSGQLN